MTFPSGVCTHLSTVWSDLKFFNGILYSALLSEAESEVVRLFRSSISDAKMCDADFRLCSLARVRESVECF